MKKKHEEHENHERWLVSYADFITLLFAFFVVMYSVSSVNEGKYRILSDSIASSFDRTKALGEPQVISMPVAQRKQIVVKDAKKSKDKSKAYLKTANALTTAKAPEGVKVTSTERGLNIRIKDDALFSSGSARLNPAIKEFLDLMAGLIKDLPNLVSVEGHTDNQPIKTAAFPSNWDLSTARANTLVRYFTEYHQLPAQRFSSTGFAGTRPIESNATPEGQASNRRVDLVVLRNNTPTVSPGHPFLP